MRVFLFILRKTWGFGKKTDVISSRQFRKDIGLDRRNIHVVLKRLINKKIIVISTDDRKRRSYGIQKNYEKWNLSCVDTPPHPVNSKEEDLSCVDTPPLSCVDMTKEAKTSCVDTPTKEIKETSLKKESTPFSLFKGKDKKQYYPDAALTDEERRVRYEERQRAKSKATHDLEQLRQEGLA